MVRWSSLDHDSKNEAEILGLYGFSTSTPIPLFPSLKLHYWASVLDVLRDQMGVEVLVVGVKG
jgi:triacylglycerol lipase